MVVIHWVCTIVIRGKFPNSVPQLLQEALSVGTTVLWYNVDINRSRKGSASGSMPYETRSLRKKFVSKTQNFFQSVRPLSA